MNILANRLPAGHRMISGSASLAVLSLVLLAHAARAAEMKMIAVINRDGRAYVAGAALERDASIALKPLPGQKQIVACSGDRCALVKDFVTDGADTLVPVEALAAALDAKALFDAARANVGFEFSATASVPSDSTARVGRLAPNFRLKKLDGSTVSLADFRGKRVLINSWASW